MKYLLDANAVILSLKRPWTRLGEILRSKRRADVAVSSIVLAELYYGAFKSELRDQSLVIVDDLAFEVLTFDRQDARHAGEIREFLRRRGTPIGPYDALIAGQARARDLVLITHNVQEFSRVPGLRIEDWESAP